MARISKPPEERRQELIQAAQELFMQQGYEKTMVGDIVRRVGVAQGLFYYYFRSKQDIFLAVINQYTEERIGELAVSLRDTSIPMLDRVRNLLHVLMAFLREMDVMYPKNRGEMASEMSPIDATTCFDDSLSFSMACPASSARARPAVTADTPLCMPSTDWRMPL